MRKHFSPNAHNSINVQVTLKSKLTVKFFLLIAGIFFSLNTSFAQCPIPATCTPGGPTNSNAAAFNMGIRRVTIGSINRISQFVQSGNLVSYEDFSCSDSTNITVGISTSITVVTNGNPPTNTANENVRVWIDYNNDGAFTSNELAFSSNNKQTHTGSISIPGSAITNTPLRMRVAAEWISATNSIPTACGDREYSQVEDYKVVIIPNLLPPSTDFSASPRTSCNGVVQFQDLSVNAPTSWFWDFGDGNFSTLQNPQYTYTTSDTFDVTLIATNANGSDTVVKTDYIIRTGLVTGAANCTPITNAYCCGYGITNFQLGSINNSSADASVGYEDFTCTQSTQLIEGFSYPVSFTTNQTAAENIKLYIDLNANGSFQDPGELLYSANNVSSPTTNIIIPAAQAPYSTPLRLRVISDAVGSTFNSCTNLTRGQAEDYTVVLNPNPFPPVANYLDDQVNACQTTIQFTDNTLNAPFQWFWDFGDGNTDTVQNPVHTYTTFGNYTVKLVVTNGIGSDSTSRNFTVSGGAIPAVCTPTTAQTFFPLGIEQVIFNTINNITSASAPFPPYEDFACDFTTTVTQGQQVAMTVMTQSNFTPSDVKAWLDYNNNGTFEANEEIFNSTNLVTHTQIVSISNSPGVVTGTGLRLRVVSEFINASNGPIPCGLLEFGQTEDYTVIINAPAVPPSADFTVPFFTTCNGSVDFFDASGFSPNQWTWNFGDGNTSTIQNPSHTYTSIGSYFVRLTACNAFGCDSIQKVINVTSLTGVKSPLCTPTSNAVNQNIGIFNVTFNNLNVSTTSSVGYSDFGCDNFAELVEGNAYPLEITVGTFNNHTVEAWIDYNNNGVFTVNEKVFTDDGFGTLNNVVIVPASAVKNQFLRMRVIANSTASGAGPFDPCLNIANGEIEDYGVLIRSNNVVPVAEFDAQPLSSCNGEIAFKNMSYNNPTSYLWDFGDGTNSIQKNPVHRYTNTGNYTVKLRAQNGFGLDSVVKSAFIAVNQVQDPVQASCYPLTQFTHKDFGITGLELASINSTNSILDGYENYACTDTAHLKRGQNYSVVVKTSILVRANVRVYADFNNDGIFQEPDELVLTSNNRIANHTGTLSVPNDAVLNKILRLRVWSDMATSPLGTNISCVNPEYGQVEDYGILVAGPVSIDKLIENGVKLYPNPAQNEFVLELPESNANSLLHIYNYQGKLVKSLIMNNSVKQTVNVSDLESGMYYLRIENSDYNQTIKFIKN